MNQIKKFKLIKQKEKRPEILEKFQLNERWLLWSHDEDDEDEDEGDDEEFERCGALRSNCAEQWSNEGADDAMYIYIYIDTSCIVNL